VRTFGAPSTLKTSAPQLTNVKGPGQGRALYQRRTAQTFVGSGEARGEAAPTPIAHAVSNATRKLSLTLI